jgi:hypothetical protein
MFYTVFPSTDFENSYEVKFVHFQDKRPEKYTTMYKKVHFLSPEYLKEHFDKKKSTPYNH